jgi:hypothetical protein
VGTIRHTKHRCCVSGTVLKVAPKDEDAVKSKAVILINTAKFEEALVFVKDNSLEKALAFEKVRT